MNTRGLAPAPAASLCNFASKGVATKLMDKPGPLSLLSSLFFLGLQFVCLSLFTSPRLFPAGQSDEVVFYFNLGCTDCLTPRKGSDKLTYANDGEYVEGMSWYKRVHESTKYRRFETEEVVGTKQSGDNGANRRKF
jgi:hypothetical protein